MKEERNNIRDGTVIKENKRKNNKEEQEKKEKETQEGKD